MQLLLTVAGLYLGHTKLISYLGLLTVFMTEGKTITNIIINSLGCRSKSYINIHLT